MASEYSSTTNLFKAHSWHQYKMNSLYLYCCIFVQLRIECVYTKFNYLMAKFLFIDFVNVLLLAIKELWHKPTNRHVLLHRKGSHY